MSVQPRIRLNRSFDERSHGYLGYSLWIDGCMENETRKFLIGIGKAAQSGLSLTAGCRIEGLCQPVADPETESVEFYKVSKLKVLERPAEESIVPPPWHGLSPDLNIYRARGHRRLNAETYNSKCLTCIWGCRMAVEMIIDQWNPQNRRYRFETFCYGPKRCSFYKAGPTRKVPGRKGMSWEEEDWVDEDATSHRQPDE